MKLLGDNQKFNNATYEISSKSHQNKPNQYLIRNSYLILTGLKMIDDDTAQAHTVFKLFSFILNLYKFNPIF